MGFVAFLAALLLAQAPQAPASLPTPETRIDWEQVSGEADGQVFIDPASIRRDGAIIRFTIRLALAEELAGASHMFLRHVMDCTRRTIGYEAGAAYDAERRLLNARESAPAEIELNPIEPGSIEAMLHGRLCAGNGTA